MNILKYIINKILVLGKFKTTNFTSDIEEREKNARIKKVTKFLRKLNTLCRQERLFLSGDNISFVQSIWNYADSFEPYPIKIGDIDIKTVTNRKGFYIEATVKDNGDVNIVRFSNSYVAPSKQ